MGHTHTIPKQKAMENVWTRTKTQWTKPKTFSYNYLPPPWSVMALPRHCKGILGIWDLTKVRCMIRKNGKYWLTGKGIRLLSGKRDPPKSGHGKRDYLNVCWEILGSSSKCESTRWAFSGVSYQSKLYSVNKNWPRLSSNNYKQTSRLKPHFYNWMPGMSLWS